MESPFKIYVFRLKPHENLKESILQFAKQNNIKAGIIVTCVGSLEQIHIRYANQEAGTKVQGMFEIVSCSGTFSNDDTSHIHISVSNISGLTLGGHLLDENKIYTTAEIAVASLTDLQFLREVDPTYGYRELLVKSIRE
jgi:uncharacterized protein